MGGIRADLWSSNRHRPEVPSRQVCQVAAGINDAEQREEDNTDGEGDNGLSPWPS